MFALIINHGHSKIIAFTLEPILIFVWKRMIAWSMSGMVTNTHKDTSDISGIHTSAPTARRTGACSCSGDAARR
jgi:hypothetical protein